LREEQVDARAYGKVRCQYHAFAKSIAAVGAEDFSAIGFHDFVLACRLISPNVSAWMAPDIGESA
jgi:hypothetical protein